MTPDYPEGIPGAICDAAIVALSDHRVSANGEAMSGQSENPRAVAGDNSGAVQDEPATRFAKGQLKAIIERTEEKKAISDDIRADKERYEVKALRAIGRMHKQDADERQEHEANMQAMKL